MSRNTLHLGTDILLFLAVAGLALTGLLLEFVLPSGRGRMLLWGWNRHQWGDLHFWLAVSALAIGAIHVALNWAWVCAVVVHLCGVKGPLGGARRSIAGLLFLAIILALVTAFLFLARASIREGPAGSGQGSAHTEGDWGQGRGLGQGQGRGRGQHRDRESTTEPTDPATTPP